MSYKSEATQDFLIRFCTNINHVRWQTDSKNCNSSLFLIFASHSFEYRENMQYARTIPLFPLCFEIGLYVPLNIANTCTCFVNNHYLLNKLKPYMGFCLQNFAKVLSITRHWSECKNCNCARSFNRVGVYVVLSHHHYTQCGKLQLWISVWHLYL